MTNIVFIMSKCPYYRIPLYNELSKHLDIKFIFTLEEQKIPGLKAPYILYKGFGYKKFRIHFGLKKILEKEKPKKVILFQPDPLQTIDNWHLSRYLTEKRIHYYLHIGRWEYKKTELKTRITNLLNIKLIKNSEKIFAYSTRTERWLLKLGINKKKIIKVYNINPYIYENFNKKIKTIPELKNKKIVLYVGRLIKRKGIDYLIKAFKKIQDKEAVLILVGGGDFYKLGAKSEETKLKKLVKELNLENQIIFTGQISPEKTKEYYANCDIFVCPSITKKVGEAWGHVVEEAMSFGKPIIVTDAVGAGEDLVQEGKNGFIVPEKNSEELKKAIEKILKNKKLKEKMGKESLRIIKQKKFSFEEIIKNWEKGLN